jgi:leader peptidase (prepilin peptidase)/N-methyltransferase
MVTCDTQSARWLAHFGFAALYIVTCLPALQMHVHGVEVWSGAAVLGAFLVPLSAIDIRTFRLPDPLTLPLAAAGLLYYAITDVHALPRHALAAAIGFLSLYSIGILYRRIRGRAGLGLGDAKLFAGAGAWTGLAHIADVMLTASLLGLVYVSGKTLVRGSFDTQTKIAFGPFLALGIWLVWLYGMA